MKCIYQACTHLFDVSSGSVRPFQATHDQGIHAEESFGLEFLARSPVLSLTVYLSRWAWPTLSSTVYLSKLRVPTLALRVDLIPLY